MDFGLSEDQQMLRDAVSRCLADTSPLSHVRECAERDNPLSDQALRALNDLGVAGMLVPEEHGGLGMTLLDAAVVAEQLGYAVAPVPFLASQVLAPIALRDAGSEEQKAHWLPKIASGEARIGVAISETIEVRDGAGVSSAGGKLNGTALFALDFEGADAYIVADSGGRLHLVGANASGLEAIALTTIDRTRSVGELRFDGTAAEPLADDGGVATARLRAAGRVILAADSLGAGQAMIEKAVDYAGQREQFGRLIGSFQAVKHMCAEMAARHEPCRSLVWYAAHAFDAVPNEASLVACHAKSHTAEVHRFVARTSTEVHGGMGFTDLLGLHYWFKRIGFDRQVLGGPEAVRAEAAALQGWAKAALCFYRETRALKQPPRSERRTDVTDWNLGDILDAFEPAMPKDAPALIHGDRIITWPEMSARSNNVARALRQRGAGNGAKVAFYMRNRPEYGELMAACFKGRLIHVNINYRYVAEEVFYIFDDSDSEVIVYSSEFRDCIVELKDRLGKVHTFVEIGEASQIAPFAIPYETLAQEGDGSALGIVRSPEDQLFIYTGGTTGMPKGVMWHHDQMRKAQLEAQKLLAPVPKTLEEHVALITSQGPGNRTLPSCPMMHGTGFITAIGTLMSGGAIVTLADPSFDATELWETVDKHKVQSIAIVGDAFAKPMLQALDENPGRWDTSSLVTIVSSGVMWSKEVKAGLCKHIPQVVLMDSFGASEGLGFGRSITTAQGGTNTAKFAIGEFCDVFDENDQKVTPGSGVPGFIALMGAIPAGYYKDPEKSAKTFRTIDGVRYSIPGDWCMVEADGSLTLLGRGSVCINTAGEKVYPEEVEEILKTHPAIGDALVVGVPNEKWGQAVTAVVHLSGDAPFDEQAVKDHVRGQLAGYKTPKAIYPTDTPLRASNGKADYATAKAIAESLTAAS